MNFIESKRGEKIVLYIEKIKFRDKSEKYNKSSLGYISIISLSGVYIPCRSGERENNFFLWFSNERDARRASMALMMIN